MAGKSRTQARAAKVLSQKRQLRADIVRVSVAELKNLHNAQRMFVAIVKEQGRVRISDATLDSLGEGDRVTMKHVEGGAMLTYVATAAREATPEPEAEDTAPEQAEEADDAG